ncbi:MAG: alpha/beta hydrolase [Pseudomonadota bacterium]
MTYLKTRDGTDLFYKSWGDGPPVILIHGWPLGADMWDAQAMALAENGFRAIAYDRRGFLRSAQPWDGYDYDTLSDDLADVMQETGATADVTLVGFSMGGGEVARYMTRHGGKGVRAAALIGAVTPFLLKTDDNPDGVDGSVFEDIKDGIRKDRAHFFNKTFMPAVFGVGWVSSPVSEELVAGAADVAVRAGLKPTLACVDAFGRTDFRADCAAFRVPTLIIHGTADKTVPIDVSARKTAQLIPGAQLVEYDGEPHGLVATQSDRVTKDLLTFLGR